MLIQQIIDEIESILGIRLPAEPVELLVNRILSDVWWALCRRSAQDDTPWLTRLVDGDLEANPLYLLVVESEEDAADRLLAVACAADAARRWLHGHAGGGHALLRAAALWAGNGTMVDQSDVGDLPFETSLARLREAWPDHAWTPVAHLVRHILAPHVPKNRSSRQTRLPVLLSDSIEIGNLVMTPHEDGSPAELWPDPVGMMFSDVDDAAIEQLNAAWHWAINQDRFPHGQWCSWSIVDRAGLPLPRVPDLLVGSTAAAGLAYAFRLAARTRREPRRDALVIAVLHRSGALGVC
jgi:hypothetical protein